jgi:hypothetical protein
MAGIGQQLTPSRKPVVPDQPESDEILQVLGSLRAASDGSKFCAVGQVLWVFKSKPGRREACRNERARQAVAKLKANSSSEYEYASGPLREPVVELLSKDQSTIAALTRVHYGAIVLNSSNVFFADVDRPNASRFSAILSFFQIERSRFHCRLGHG